MKSKAVALALVATLLGATAAETALAHGGYHHGGPRVSVGLGFGFGPYWPGYGPGYWGAPYPYYPPYAYSPYYYPQVVTTPPTYIERGDAQAAPQDGPRDSWWYYCPEAKAYYPYVKQCAGGWQKVSPEPQAEAR